MFPTRPSLAVLLLASIVACGERPQRIEAGTPAATGHTAAHETAESPVRFSGKVLLVGDAAVPDAAAVFVSARLKGQRLPALSRRFGMSDPDWTTADGGKVLRFQLTDADNMGGFNTPLAAEMEVEALYDVDGFIDTSAGADGSGVIKVSVPASPGDQDLEIRVQLDAGG